MRAMKIAALLGLMFALALGAGVVTGRLTARPPAPPAGTPHRSVLSEELQLTPAQRERMRPIWEAARDTARACARDAEDVEREHQERLKALLTDEQKARYQTLSEEDHRRIAALDARRKEAFRRAVEQTRLLLREEQRQAYQRIISSQVGDVEGPPGADGTPPGQGGPEGP